MSGNHSTGLTVIFILGILLSTGSAQNTHLKVDTLLISQPEELIHLNHPLIIDTTFFLFHKSSLIDSFNLDPVEGNLIVTKTLQYPVTLIATYQVLQDRLPLIVGPLYHSFPMVDSLISKKRKDKLKNEIIQDSDILNSKVITSGTFYRNVNVSPLIGTNFSGGIQLSLDGKLSDDMTISGVLTDQSIPFQSEGSTQTLSEIDKIYLHVKHPYFSVTGGDISFEKNYGKYLNINKTMIGLNNYFNLNKWSGDFIIGGTKGKYHSLLFFGTDRNQGPYFLTSKSGNRNIVVIAGSESVWLDGKKLRRGRNDDYTIDYNNAELRFTPKRLIHFDSEIFVEYEYSDFNYSNDLLGGLIKFEKSEKINTTLSWIQEKDKFNNDLINLNEAEQDSLESVGDKEFILSTASPDSIGDYILLEGIFIYFPGTTSEDKYTIRFYYDEIGNYIRKISPDGTLYYEYIPDNLKSTWNDYYSPIKNILKPVKMNYYHLQGNYPISEKGYGKVEIALSQTDLNTESSIDDKDNVGMAYNFDLRLENITVSRWINLDIDSKHWQRETQFHSLGNDRDAGFYTKWNITEPVSGFEALSEGRMTLNVEKFGFFKTSFGEYKNSDHVKQQFLSEGAISFKYIPEIKSVLNIVRSPSENYYNSINNWVFLPGTLHPFVDVVFEESEDKYSFNHITGGFLWNTEHRKMKLSYGRRDDFRNKEEIDIMSQTGELKIEQSNYSEWNGILHLIKRHVVSNAENPDLDYLLGDLKFSYGQRSSVIRWEGFFRLEESLTETKTVVYDSVGTGLGRYRYDPEYDSYFSDPNGAFIAFTVPTGLRNLSTHFSSSQTLNIRFPKNRIPMFRYGKIRIISQMNFQGNGLGINKFIHFNINDTNTQLAKMSLKSEYIFRPLGPLNNGKLWYNFQKDMNGNDPRGYRVRKDNILGVEWKKAMNDFVQIEHLSTIRQAEVTSQFNAVDSRTLWSIWIENGINTALSSTNYFRILSTIGRASGEHEEIIYTSDAMGLKTNSTIFFGKKNRGEFSLEWTKISISDHSVSLPPEAFHGLSEGISFSCSGRGRFALGENIYLQLDVRLINNKRYDNLINVNAEVRSHF